MMTFTFNGRNSRDFGLYIEEYPSEAGGQKIIKSVSIPGRTGALTIDTGAISNVAKSYQVMFRHYQSTQMMREVRQWLALSSGYCRLEDDYDPDVFRLARITNLPSFENHINRYGRGTLDFDCDPRRFLKEGELAQTGSFDNPFMPSKPLIRIGRTDGATATVTIAGQSITIDGVMQGDLVIVDSELMEVTDGDGYDAGIFTSMSEFPEIPHGAVSVSATGTTSIEIIPRFWQP